MQPEAERGWQVRYGYGWFWQQYDHNHAALVPPSTAYPTPALVWWHPERCPVDLTSGLGCTCQQERKEYGETQAV